MAIAALVSLMPGAARAAEPRVKLLLEIVVNGRDTGDIGSFYQTGDVLLARRGALTGRCRQPAAGERRARPAGAWFWRAEL